MMLRFPETAGYMGVFFVVELITLKMGANKPV